MARPTRNYQELLRSFPRSAKINRVSIGAEMLYIRLLALADCLGHFPASPRRVLALALAERWESEEIEAADVARWLDELSNAGLIERYEVAGEVLLELQDYFRSANNRVVPAWPKRPDPDGPQCGDADVPTLGTRVEVHGGHGSPHLGDSTETETETETETDRARAREASRTSGPLREAEAPDDSKRPTPRRVTLRSVWPPDTQPEVLTALGRYVLDPLAEYASQLERVGQVAERVRIPGIQQAVLQELRYDPGRPSRLAELAYGADTRKAILAAVRAWLDRVDESLASARNIQTMGDAVFRSGVAPNAYQADGFFRRTKPEVA